MPEPMTPPDCDLRDFQFMPLDIVRLFSSEFHAVASDSEWRAGVTLWLKSFHQVPAASLPDDDVQLCRLAELGRDLKAWRKLRAGALHGWVSCDDGRLYHPVVAEKASEAWERKKFQRERSKRANEARWSRNGRADEPQSNPRVGADGSPSAILDGAPDETIEESARNASSILGRYQGTGTGTGIEESSDELSLGAQAPAKSKPSRRKPETAIPDGFPDQRAKLEARECARAAAKDLQVETQAERFRNHAQQHDRRARDWAAAWRNWVSKALESAPAAQAAGQAAALTLDPNGSWRVRMGRLINEKFWADLDWGVRPRREAPQREGVNVPDAVLIEFGFPTATSAEAAA